MNVTLIVLTLVLCTILLLIILYRLRSVLPWRVNCWFCNRYSWVKYPEHNNWTCPSCDQYNGFTKDGDYNKPIVLTNDQVSRTPKVFQKSPPRNGLCKMCNINQQLKVTRLANFVPMYEKNFTEEIEVYRMQLEKAYQLCSPCKRVLQDKLHKEEETLLSSKLLENHSPGKMQQKQKTQSKALSDLINNTSMLIAALLFIVVSYEFYGKIMDNKNIPQINFRLNILDCINMAAQEVLGVIACLLQIIAIIWNANTLRYTIAINLLWTVFLLSTSEIIVTMNPVLTSIIKMTSVIMLLLVYKYTKEPATSTPRKQTSLMPTKLFANSTVSSLIDEDDQMDMDSDDDVLPNKFDLHNLTDSSNKTISPLSATLMDGRTFTPRNNSISTKPKLNSTFCVNSIMCKSPNSTAETVLEKPSYEEYQKLVEDDSDSDLDESISLLSLGGPTRTKNKTNSIFSLRKFIASPNFVTPTAARRRGPLISPSNLGHSTSWVAGGYWGAESDRLTFNADGSRSSSQSSGFESRPSSMNTRNMFSPPPSREESVHGEPAPALLDQFNTNSYHSLMPQNFSRMSSPVFLQVQCNGPVHIPQAQFPLHPAHNMFHH